MLYAFIVSTLVHSTNRKYQYFSKALRQSLRCRILTYLKASRTIGNVAMFIITINILTVILIDIVVMRISILSLWCKRCTAL